VRGNGGNVEMDEMEPTTDGEKWRKVGEKLEKMVEKSKDNLVDNRFFFPRPKLKETCSVESSRSKDAIPKCGSCRKC
jgi:hypothetical protein